MDTAVYDESALEPGLAVPGPAVVTTPTTTYLVQPGWRIGTGAHGAIWFLADSREQENRRRATPSSRLRSRNSSRRRAETTLFLGPDPQIMNNHRMARRTAEENRLLSGPVDANDLDRVRKRIVAGLDEAFEMMEQTGAAPGAKWGDLTSAVYSASGDLIHISTGGVLAFASVLHYPVRFINKYWINDPSVGVHDGDAFIHNDARYGNIHNTDQSMILPVFYAGELIAWVATIIHEGENGAKEPGGMPSSSESAYDDGIRMSPFKIVERGVIRRDLLTFLQNSVREPKLQYQDLKVKLYSAQRIKDRLVALIDEVGRDAFIASLRKSLEDIEAEARRRIAALPDGTFRVNFFSDSTLRENVLLKYPCAITVKGDEMTIDWRGAAPQFLNRAFNATLGTAKCGLGQALLGFFWPDLPRGITVSSGSKFPAIPGLFGGYGCPTYPLAKIKGVNIFDVLHSAPETWSFDFETLMNSRPFADARYSTHHMGMGFELADEGEVYMICQGTGGGYGDVLERDPEAVMADVEAGYLSSQAAREIYFVVHDPTTLGVDVEGTEAARAAERRARLDRGRPYDEFVKLWVTPEPPAHLPYYGSWGDDNNTIHATAWTTHGPVRVAAPMSQLPQIFLPDPNIIVLATQQARIAELETRVSELEDR